MKDPSVIVSFRVKVESPLYKWLKAQSDAGNAVSDVVRDIMAAYEARWIETQRWQAISAQAHYGKLKDCFFLSRTDMKHFDFWVRSRKLNYFIDQPSRRHVARELQQLEVYNGTKPMFGSQHKSCCQAILKKTHFAKWCIEEFSQEEE